jgi:hypothetical protein
VVVVVVVVIGIFVTVVLALLDCRLANGCAKTMCGVDWLFMRHVSAHLQVMIPTNIILVHDSTCFL